MKKLIAGWLRRADSTLQHLRCRLKHMRESLDLSRHETLRVHWFDTFESWADEAHGGGFRLFTQQGRRGPVVSNFEVSHLLYRGNVWSRLLQLRVTIDAVTPEMVELFARDTEVGVWIADMPRASFPLRVAMAGFDWPHGVPVPPRQPFEVLLRFGREAEEQLVRWKDAVGPRAGWVSIRVGLTVDKYREVT